MTTEDAQDLEMVRAEGNETVQDPEAAASWLRRVRLRARQLRRLYEKACNEELTGYDKRNEGRLELELRQLFLGAGLTLELNTDPRGAPVGIRPVKTGRYNTLGGDWRL